MRSRTSPRLPLLLVLGASALAAGASAATYPYLILYLHFDEHLSIALSGLVIACESAVTLASALVGGALIDRLGPRRVAAVATFVDGAGAVSLLVAHSLPFFLLASVILGASNIRTPSRRLAESQALPDDLPAPKFFSYKSMLTSAGFAVGVAAGGLAIHLADPVTYHRLLLAVALTCLLLGLSYGLLPGAPHAPALATEPRYRDALGDSKLARYLGFIFLVTFVSYGSLFTGLGALVAIDLRQSTRIVALGLVATSVAVVALQRPVYALVTRLGTRRAILLAVSCLAAAWLVLLASLAGRPAVIPAVVGFALLLAVGDAALAPIRTPLLLAIAPARLRGRYSGLAKLAHSAANIAGPIAATEAIGHRLAGLWLPVLATLAAGAGLVGASLTRHVAIPDQGET